MKTMVVRNFYRIKDADAVNVAETSSVEEAFLMKLEDYNVFEVQKIVLWDEDSRLTLESECKIS